MIIKPKITLKEAREKFPKETKLLDRVIAKFLSDFWDAKNECGRSLKDEHLGYEATLESIEELIDAGLLKVSQDIVTGNFGMLVYDNENEEYTPIHRHRRDEVE